VGYKVRYKVAALGDKPPLSWHAQDMDERKLRTVPEVARELRVNRETVYRAIRRNELEVVRIGSVIRVPAASLAQLKQPKGAS
jgi:excisionase family DNA binding protein